MTDANCVRTANEAAQHLLTLGHDVEEVVPQISYDEMTSVCFELFLAGMAEGVLNVSALTGKPVDENHLEPHLLATVEYAKTRSSLDFRSALNRMVRMSREMADFHQRYDALLTPGAAQLPCNIGLYNASRYAGTGVEYWNVEGPLYAF